MDNNTQRFISSTWARDFTYEEAIAAAEKHSVTFTREEFNAQCSELDKLIAASA
jgi:hypothetical protein